jgi:aminomethyltransferase
MPANPPYAISSRTISAGESASASPRYPTAKHARPSAYTRERGQRSLIAEKANGSKNALVGLVLDWDEQEALYARHGLPVQVSTAAWRNAVPVYEMKGTRQIGKATSGTWSPIVKKNLALASLEKAYAQPGTKLKIEYTVEHQRETVTAVVTPMPFYNPEHKKS